MDKKFLVGSIDVITPISSQRQHWFWQRYLDPFRRHRDLPCPVRLNLPPSQSASVLQLCLPGSCNTHRIRVSVCAQLGMWRTTAYPRHLNKAMWKWSGTSLLSFGSEQFLHLLTAKSFNYYFSVVQMSNYRSTPGSKKQLLFCFSI